MEQQTEIDNMRNALSSIACEIQRFHESSQSGSAVTSINQDEQMFTELLKYKSKIQSKRDRIQKLRKNLRTACFVVKTVASAKKDDSLKEHLTFARSECTDLLEKHKNDREIINCLSRENEKLNSKLDNMANFIQLGYKELQKIRDEPIQDTSTLVQLRKLIICCGEYYANYCNDHENCLRLKQRNNFLKSKILILENNVETISEQLKSLQRRNERLKKENHFVRDKYTKYYGPFKNLQVASSEVNVNPVKETLSTDEVDKTISKREFDASQQKLDCEHYFDLSSHLIIVKKLLNGQDTLLQNLKILSQEFSTTYL